jgi:hypothetical protein
MKNLQARRLNTLVLGSVLGVVGTVATYSFRPADSRDIGNPPQQPTDSSETRKSVVADPGLTPRLHETEAQLAAALRRIDELYAQQEQSWRRTAEWVEALLAATPVPPSERAGSWNLYRRRIALLTDEKASFFDEFDGFEDVFFLLAAAAAAGDESAADFCEMVLNEELPLDLRSEAFEVLAYVPSELSLRLLLDPPEDIAAHTSYDVRDKQVLRSLAFMVDSLSTPSVAVHADRLYNVGMNALRDAPDSGPALRLISSLGFLHGDTRSLEFVRDMRVYGVRGHELIQLAWWAGTDAGRDYVERMARIHPSVDVRREAQTILAAWP